MKCERIHPLFSDLMEGQLEGDLRAAARRHLEECEPCRTGLDEYVRATHALKSLETPRTSSEYAREILAAVAAAEGAAFEAAAPEEQRRMRLLRRAGAHAVSALLGAAIALLSFHLLAKEPAPSKTPPGPPPSVRVQPVEEPATLDVEAVRIENTEAPHMAPPEPWEPRIVERVVEKTRYVRRGPLVAFEVDQAAVARAADQVSRSFDSFSESLRSLGNSVREADPASLEQVAAKPDPNSSVAEEPTPISPPVVIRRVGGHLTLETSGQPYEVLPVLIGFLDDPDPVLVELVLDRLETIRRELNADPVLAGSLELEPLESGEQPALGSLAQIRSFFSRPEDPRDAQVSADMRRWDLWWNRNAVRILQARTYGTF